MKAICNGKLILAAAAGDYYVAYDKVILFADKITAIMAEADFSPAMADECIDAKGNFVSPGFINVHIHGCVGYDTMDEDPAAIKKMQEFLPKTGVTSFLPTTMTYDFVTLTKAINRVREAKQSNAGARVLGCHMEGPFISPIKKGAQCERFIAKAEYEKIAPFADVIKIITLAPEELNGDYSFIDKCKAQGIVVSLGHSNASYEIAKTAITEHGATHITHLFNAMTGLEHRNPGVAEAALDTDANCELIVDNVHVHPSIQRLVYKAKAGKNIIPITDSLRACGLGDGPSELGGQKVMVKGTLATLADGTIAGSVLCMNDGLRIFQQNTKASIAEVVRMVTKTPAEELGIYGEIGSLTVNKLADIVIFADDFTIKQVFCAGSCVYVKNN